MIHPASLPLPVRWALRLASVPYGAVVRSRNLAFDRGWKTVRRVPVPVICVGNLSTGGTGKTPCVEYVASTLRDLGRQVCLISRGYKSADSGTNDEAMLLEENLPDVPHLQNADRVEAARLAVDELEADVLVLDDGFQHRRLRRDLDIVLIDATRPPHRDGLLPGGTLREPMSALGRAGAVILTRSDAVSPTGLDDIESRVRPYLLPGVPVARAVHEPVGLIRVDGDPRPVSTLRGVCVGLVSGIGNPAAFRSTVEALGATVAAEKRYPDHHGYTRADVDELTAWAGTLPKDAWVAVTQKDHVKLRIATLAGRPVVAVRVGLKVTRGEDELRMAIHSALGEPGA
jgi:tetraacyldisaccharide 4'-kinase